MLIPVWVSATWWHLVAPDMMHLSEKVVDWVWLPREDPSLFIPGVVPGRDVVPPDWRVMGLWPSSWTSRPPSGKPLNSVNATVASTNVVGCVMPAPGGGAT